MARRMLGARGTRFAPVPAGIQAGPLKGRELLLDIGVSGSWRQMAAGAFESFLHERMKKSRDWSGAVVWDVGAHFGYHTLCLAAWVGDDGQVVAFEPNPMLRERLRENLALNPDLAKVVGVEEAAVSDRDGKAEFVCSSAVDGNASWSRLAGSKAPLPDESYAEFEKVEVSTVSLDDWFSRQSHRPPDLIKIDVEGAEFEALAGAGKILKSAHPALAVEIHNAGDAPRFCDLCEGWGYSTELLESAEDRRFFWAERKTTWNPA